MGTDMKEKCGIAVVGTVLVDLINTINTYPKIGELTQIQSVEKTVGGCVPNVAIDLKRLDPSLQVKAIGRIGKDDEGALVKQTLLSEGIDISGLIEQETKTSFTQVMSVKAGQRTFFTYAGASAAFGAADIALDTLHVKMLHLGYLLLLEKIDSGDGVRILQEAKMRGIQTSVDLVSESADRYASVLPFLPYTDNLIINELEAGALTGIAPKRENLREIAEKLMAYGVRERVIIHMKELGICLSRRGFTVVPSYDLPKNMILGTTGAGDAFCAGALLGIYQEKSDEEILSLASIAAVGALAAVDAVSGMCSTENLLKTCKNVKKFDIHL